MSQSKISSAPILVLGASGTIGRSLVQFLYEAGQPVRAGFHARPLRLAGVEDVAIDVLTGAGMAEALQGVEKLFLLTGDSADQAQAELRIVDMAQRAEVKHIVKLSAFGAEEDAYMIGRFHRAVEQVIEQSGMSYTFLRPNCFMQNFVFYYGNAIRSARNVRLPRGDAPMAFVDTRDIARVAYHTLTDPSHTNKAYELSGPEALSYAQATALLSRALGESITYTSLSEEEARAGMAPGEHLERFLDLYRFYRSGRAGRVTTAVQDVTGQPASSFETFAREYVDQLR
ncbi:SDR family oxidoreductase [Ktedonosporobacter rubrisoli]|uniref:SDR family oxidoreductase n=1 Tax=Ktedonosporobacter rubrisoli TaxID=2509675 RepID=UPI0013EEC45B|nr:SDR family oxidoreductase [Ktedonosporobacter rubrisoli]